MGPGRSEQTNSPASPGQHVPTPASEPPESPAEDLSTLSGPGGETTLVAVPVDPYVVHCQWEVAPADIEIAKRSLGVSEQEFWPVLQFYDLTNSARDEAPPEPSFVVEIQLEAGNWFVRSCGPDRGYRANLSLKGEDGSFAVIASSNPVQTPPSAPSSHANECWLPIRPDSRPPESATPEPSPTNLAPEPPSGAPSKPTAFPIRLPIDMREEVRTMLGAPYGARELEIPEPPLPGQSPLSSDMREEVRELFPRLDPQLEAEAPPPTSSLPSVEKTPIERVLRDFHVAFLETKPSAIADLTELNERSFTSGISSRTK